MHCNAAGAKELRLAALVVGCESAKVESEGDETIASLNFRSSGMPQAGPKSLFQRVEGPLRAFPLTCGTRVTVTVLKTVSDIDQSSGACSTEGGEFSEIWRSSTELFGGRITYGKGCLSRRVRNDHCLTARNARLAQHHDAQKAAGGH